MLTFTTDAMQRDMEVNGPIVLELYAASDQPDTDFFVLHRRPDAAGRRGAPRRPPAGLRRRHQGLAARLAPGQGRQAVEKPYRPIYTHADPQPLQPGRVYKFEIEVLPCAYLFRKGHRLRLEIVNRDTHSPTRYSRILTIRH